MKKLKQIFDSEIKTIDAAESTLTAYITTNGRDRMDEVVEPGGVDLKNYRKNPVVLFAHDHYNPPIGKALWTKKDDKGIIAKVKFASTDFAQEIFTLFKEGIMNAFSIGFMPKEWVDGDGGKKPRRTFTKSEMIEFSAVPVPANPEALTLALQKGLISETTKDFFTKDDELEEDKPKEEPKEEKPEEEKPEEKPEEEAEDKGLDALIAENELISERNIALREELSAKNEEIAILKFKLFQKLKKPDEKLVSEMAGEDLAKKMGEVLTGVIRNVTGKVS